MGVDDSGVKVEPHTGESERSQAPRFLEPQGTTLSARLRHIHAMYEIAHTLTDFVAAVCFIVGSVMFFWPSWLTAGTWLFLVGSVLFAVKPTIRLVKEVRLLQEG